MCHSQGKAQVHSYRNKGNLRNLQTMRGFLGNIPIAIAVYSGYIANANLVTMRQLSPAVLDSPNHIPLKSANYPVSI